MDEMETQGQRFHKQNGKLQKERERESRDNQERAQGTVLVKTCPERAADIFPVTMTVKWGCIGK